MTLARLTIDASQVTAEGELTILEAARNAGIYIPTLCHHPDLPAHDDGHGTEAVYHGSIRIDGVATEYTGCGLCLVQIEGEGIKRACNTQVWDGMIVQTDSQEVRDLRQENLSKILSQHPHTCLVCPQREGCGQESCISNVPEQERCCSKFNSCELRRIATYIGMRVDTPPYVPRGLPVIKDEPLFTRDYNLCIHCTRCVRVCRNVRGIGALNYVTTDSGVVVGTVAPTLKESGCQFCGACVEVCPTGALMDAGIVWREREEQLVPCKHACPAGVEVPHYVRLIAEKKFSEAAAVVRERVPFPATLGRVCFHPCEDACRRGKVDEPVAIKSLKRCAAELAGELRGEGLEVPAPTGKQVAVVGSGPSGMTCGYYLARQGHAVAIFEALPEPGGMLRYGIPEYRLPRDVLEREIENIRQIGVSIKTNTKIESLEELFAQGFDAIFTALGLPNGALLAVEGEDLPHVLNGIAFLRNVKLGKKLELGHRVGVIGGGNVAVDAARTALRLGAEEVTILYRRTRADMPAHAVELEHAQQEGIRVSFLLAPKSISLNGTALNVECLRMEPGENDISGRSFPVPVEGSEFILPLDNLIVAVGQTSDLPENFDLERGTAGYVKVNRESLSTSRQGVFAGGDMVSGPSTVIEAVAMGRKAADAIDRYLGGDGLNDGRLMERPKPSMHQSDETTFNPGKRVPLETLNGEANSESFLETVCGYTKEQATDEARRCLKCDLRLYLSPPVMPPEEWIEFNGDNIRHVPETEGVFELFDADRELICIKGGINIQEEMLEKLDSLEQARFFKWEEDPMYAKRESELLQQYMQKFGRMPEGNNELDDDLY